MTSRAAVSGIGILLLLALVGVGAVVIAGGATQPTLIGFFVGIGLGCLNLCLEALSMGWALRRKPSAMMAVSLGGFFFRLVLVSALVIVFSRMPDKVNAVSFALSYMASFLAFLGLQIWAVSRVSKSDGPPAGGPPGG